MPNIYHDQYIGHNNHALTANPDDVVAGYDDIAARDLDTAWNTNPENINKMIRVASPDSYWILRGTVAGPTQWVSSAGGDTLLGLTDTVSAFGAAGSVAQVAASGSQLEFGQNLTAAGTPTFQTVTVTTINIGSSSPFSDAAGVLTLENVDAIDSTTESTLEAAIDSLVNLTAVGILNTGSIASGFGAIDNGASPITTTGPVNTGDLIVGGTLTVNGTTTTINSTVVDVDDINITLGSTATPTDITADGGGITLKGDTDKTIIWDNTTNSWIVNQGWSVQGDIAVSGTVDGVDIGVSVPANTTHRTSSGVDHGFLDQSVTLASIPSFSGLVLGSATPHPSAILDASSSSLKGFLPPIMLEAARNLIASPAPGLQIYSLTSNKPEFFNGTVWQTVGTTGVFQIATNLITMVNSAALIGIGISPSLGRVHVKQLGNTATDGIAVESTIGKSGRIYYTNDSSVSLQEGTNDLQLELLEDGNVALANQLQIKGGTPGVGKHLVSDVNGLASWATPAAGVLTYNPALTYSIGNLVTVFDIPFRNKTAVAVPEAFDSAKWTCLNRNLKTGLISGGNFTINADPTKFDTDEVKGIIVDNSDPDNYLVTPVTFPATVGIVNILTGILTHIVIDVTGTLSQADRTIDRELDNIDVGTIFNSGGVGALYINESRTIYSTAQAAQAMMTSVGGQAIESVVYTPGATNLTMDATAGKVLSQGRNAPTDPSRPDISDIAAAVPVPVGKFFKVWLTSSGTVLNADTSTNEIDPNQYNPLGDTLVAVPTGKFTVQRMYAFGGSNVKSHYYGRTLYNSKEEALQAFDSSDEFTENIGTFPGAFTAYIIVQEGITDWSDPDTFKIISQAGGLAKSWHRGIPSGGIGGLTPSQQQSSLAGKSTGVFSGGGLSGTGGQTTFDIAAGTGQVIDNTVPGTTTEEQCEWTAFSAVTLTELATAKHTFVFLQKVAGVITVVQIGDDSVITEIDRKNKLYLGVIRHGNATFVGAISQPQTVASPANKLIDFYIATGKVRLSSGNEITATGAGVLTLDKGLGKSYGIGVNAFADGNNTDFVDNPTIVAASMLKYSSVGHIEGAVLSNVDTSRYDPNGATLDSELVALAGGQTRVAHRIWVEAVTNMIIFQYGQATYATEDDAIAQWNLEDLSLPTGLNESSYLRQIVIVQNGVLNLDGAVFIPVEGVGGSGGQVQPVNIIDTLVSTDPNSALSANQGRVLNNKDIASGAVNGVNVELTKNDATTVVIANAAANLANANMTLDDARTINLVSHPMVITTTTANPIMFFEPGVKWLVNFFANSVRTDVEGVALNFNAASGDLRLDEDPGTLGQVPTSQGVDKPPLWKTPVVTSAANNMQVATLIFDDQDGDPSIGVLRVHGANLDSAVFTADFGTIGTVTLSNADKLATIVFTPAVLQTDVVLTATKGTEVINISATIGVLTGFQVTDATEDSGATESTVYGSGFTVSTTVVANEGTVGAVVVAGDGRSLTFSYTRVAEPSEFDQFTVTESTVDIAVVAQLEAQAVLDFEIATASFIKTSLLGPGQWWLRLSGVNFGSGFSNTVEIIGGTNGGGDNGTLNTSGVGLFDVADNIYREVAAQYDIGPNQRWVMFNVTVGTKTMRVTVEVPEEPRGANISTVHYNQDLELLTVYGDNFNYVDNLVALGGTIEGSLNIAADFMSLSITYKPFAPTGVDVITLTRYGVDTKFHIEFKDYVASGVWIDMSSEPLPDHSGTGQETTQVGSTHHYDGQGFDDLALWNNIKMDLDNPKSIRILYSTNQTAGISSMIGFHQTDSQGVDTTQYNSAQSLGVLYHNGSTLFTAYWGVGSPTNTSIQVDGGIGGNVVADDIYMIELAAIGEDFGNKMTVPVGTPQTINPGQAGSWIKIYHVINPAGDLLDPNNYEYYRGVPIEAGQFSTGFISPMVTGDRIMDMRFYMLGDP